MSWSSLNILKCFLVFAKRKESEVWRKVISSKIIVTVVTQGLSSSFLSRPVAYFHNIQLFRERLSEKLCTGQSRKVIWDMISALFLTMYLSTLLLLLSFSTCKHTSMASRAILWNFFEKQWTPNHPQYPSGLWLALFPTTYLEIAVCGNSLI